MGRQRVRKHHRRTRLWVFISIVLVAIASFLIIDYITRPCVKALPQTVSVPLPSWANHVPEQAQGLRFLNFSRIFMTPGGGSVIENPTVLRIHELNLNISIFEVEYGLTISLSDQASVSVIKLDSKTYSSLSSALAGAKSLAHERYLNYTIFNVFPSGGSRTQRGYLSVNATAVFYIEGQTSSLDQLKRVLAAPAGPNGSRFFDSPRRVSTYYLLTRDDPAPIGFSMLNGARVAGTIEWSSVIQPTSSGHKLVNVYTYRTQQDALANLQTARQLLFARASQYCVEGGNLVVTNLYKPSDLKTLIGGL